jgi:hypothetical protein
MQPITALLKKRTYSLLTNRKINEHLSTQGHNFSMMTSKKTLGKTHLHANTLKMLKMWLLLSILNIKNIRYRHELPLLMTAEFSVLTFLPNQHSSQTGQQNFLPTVALHYHP